MTNELVLVALVFTLGAFSLLWAEDMWKDFYHWGPPFQVGSIVIETWATWRLFVFLLIIYQSLNVYLEETSGRAFEREHIQNTRKWTSYDVFLMSCYNLYKWLGTILHILVAVTRVDIWIAIALVDTMARAYLWSYRETGRRPRVFSF